MHVGFYHKQVFNDFMVWLSQTTKLERLSVNLELQ